VTVAEHSPAADHRPAILWADDFALTGGVSAGIEQLIAAGRLSGTSALVTTRHWPSHARRLLNLRSRIAIGFHLNLTLGGPLGPMPHLAPSGTFPNSARLLELGFAGRLDEAEIAEEITRQLDRFEDMIGQPPDVIDGHHHVHVYPQVRRALLQVLAKRYQGTKPMLRDTADNPLAITFRHASVGRSLGLSLLAIGFGARARALGFPTNLGFSGVSPFDERLPFSRELRRFFRRPGPDHLIMCHPGYADEELARIDTLVARREVELAALFLDSDLPARIRHPSRDAMGHISWGAGNA